MPRTMASLCLLACSCPAGRGRRGGSARLGGGWDVAAKTRPSARTCMHPWRKCRCAFWREVPSRRNHREGVPVIPSKLPHVSPAAPGLNRGPPLVSQPASSACPETRQRLIPTRVRAQDWLRAPADRGAGPAACDTLDFRTCVGSCPSTVLPRPGTGANSPAGPSEEKTGEDWGRRGLGPHSTHAAGAHAALQRSPGYAHRLRFRRLEVRRPSWKITAWDASPSPRANGILGTESLFGSLIQRRLCSVVMSTDGAPSSVGRLGHRGPRVSSALYGSNPSPRRRSTCSPEESQDSGSQRPEPHLPIRPPAPPCHPCLRTVETRASHPPRHPCSGTRSGARGLLPRSLCQPSHGLGIPAPPPSARHRTHPLSGPLSRLSPSRDYLGPLRPHAPLPPLGISPSFFPISPSSSPPPSMLVGSSSFSSRALSLR